MAFPNLASSLFSDSLSNIIPNALNVSTHTTYSRHVKASNFLFIHVINILASYIIEKLTLKKPTRMTKTISFNDLRRIKDSLPDGATTRIADALNTTPQTVRNYFGGSNYQFGKNCGLHIEPGPDGGIVVLDDTTIYDMAVEILHEAEAKG